MHTAPAVTVDLQPSWFYCAMVMTIAIILIAACALFYWASGHFSYVNMVQTALSTAVIAIGLHDAFKLPKAQLRFEGGQWWLTQGLHETVGTLQPFVDLQFYLLVRFEAQTTSTTTWLHLERPRALRTRQAHRAHDNAGDDPAVWLWAHHWMDLRRAVYSRSQHPFAHDQPTHS